MAAQGRDGARRRTRSLDERKRIVEEALAPGASVAAVARRHGLNANLDLQVDTSLARGLAAIAARADEGEAGGGAAAGDDGAGLRSREAA